METSAGKRNDYRARRVALGLTQREIAQRAGCSHMSVSLVERGKGGPRKPFLLRGDFFCFADSRKGGTHDCPYLALRGVLNSQGRNRAAGECRASQKNVDAKHLIAFRGLPDA